MRTLLLSLLLCSLAIGALGQGYSFDSTFWNNKQKFDVKVKVLSDDFVRLTIFRSSKRILSEKIDRAGLLNIEYVDFDKDKSRDILLTYGGNNATYYLYLFDNRTNTFRYVKGFDNFPEAIQLQANPRYYYSYHRAGCADLNWVSDLFVIENFRAIHKGHIYGRGCDSDTKSEPQTIYIYRIRNNNEEDKKLVARLPLLSYIASFGEKWTFIGRYWNRNYRRFQ